MSEAAKASGTAERIGLIAAIVVPAALVALWASPRAARPTEMPPLALSARDVRESMARDHRLASSSPADEALEERRRGLYLAHGLSEVHADESPEEAAGRRAEMGAVVHELEEAGGEEAIAAARARDLARLMPALRATGQDAELNATERAGELGLFPTMLARYGATVDGRRVAPEIVLRTLFAARWNAIHGRELTDGMDEIALRAYYGWLALEGGEAPISMRRTALDRYAEVHGPRALEARGTLEFEAGELATAREAFREAYAITGSVRLRNHALACEAALAEGGGETEETAPAETLD